MICPPPDRFAPAHKVQWAKWAKGAPPFAAKRQRRSGRRAQGVRYEKKVHEYLAAVYPDEYVASPWIYFQESGADRPRWCQPDGLLFDLQKGIITIVEVKYQHTSDAWWQLTQLYRPVLEKIFPLTLWQMQCVEVVKWYDPATVFPERVALLEEPTERLKSGFGVHIWKP